MTTLTVNVKNDDDLPVLKEILNRFGLSYKVHEEDFLNKEDKLYHKFKQSFNEVKEWESGKRNLQDAKEAIAEIASELHNV